MNFRLTVFFVLAVFCQENSQIPNESWFENCANSDFENILQDDQDTREIIEVSDDISDIGCFEENIDNEDDFIVNKYMLRPYIEMNPYHISDILDAEFSSEQKDYKDLMKYKNEDVVNRLGNQNYEAEEFDITYVSPEKCNDSKSKNSKKSRKKKFKMTDSNQHRDFATFFAINDQEDKEYEDMGVVEENDFTKYENSQISLHESNISHERVNDFKVKKKRRFNVFDSIACKTATNNNYFIFVENENNKSGENNNQKQAQHQTPILFNTDNRNDTESCIQTTSSRSDFFSDKNTKKHRRQPSEIRSSDLYSICGIRNFNKNENSDKNSNSSYFKSSTNITEPSIQESSQEKQNEHHRLAKEKKNSESILYKISLDKESKVNRKDAFEETTDIFKKITMKKTANPTEPNYSENNTDLKKKKLKRI
ncbi:hypothetical protein EDEG_02929 [Edhazardia aedis USNM 41457]|uniref:Uncharacterized protein n=1 Tax=Edhazardia aedis (strain USNM 41457) TaxID=1003232 RepID=J8ZSN9_EDHAE|nr:hypothetical protein EDEG_02929 [Edhazardia aedis USNM 41457]|eukprot:EJW02673.1 hypothetical protein EDEG_02929 [Edhazardia aedis USNM 41457]